MARRQERREEERGSEGEADQQDDEMDGRESNRKHKMRTEGGGNIRVFMHLYIILSLSRKSSERWWCPFSRKTYLENEHVKLKQTTTQAHYTVSRLRKTFTSAIANIQQRASFSNVPMKEENVTLNLLGAHQYAAYHLNLLFPSLVRTGGSTNIKAVTSRCKHRT